MIDTYIPGLADHPWYVLLALISALLIVQKIEYMVLCKKHHGSPPHRPFDLTFGFRILYDLLDTGIKGTTPKYLSELLQNTGYRTAMFKIAGEDTLFTTDPENIKAMLATQFTDFELGTRHKCISILLGDGIFTLDGEGWKHSRAMLRPQFTREQVSHVTSLEPLVQKLVARIRNVNEHAFDIQSLFFSFTLDSGTDFLFGESCDSLSEGMDEQNVLENKKGVDPEIRKKYPEAFNYSLTVLRNRLYLQKLRWLGTPSKFKETNRIIREFTDFYVYKVLGETEEERQHNSRGGHVFLYELLKETQDPIVLRDQALNILLAARDTTAELLTFTIYELARNPRVFKILRNAIVDAFGDGENTNLDLITFESLKRCEYLKWVLNEVLRMYPPVPRNFRVSKHDTTLPRGVGSDESSPIFVKKGTMTSYSVYSMQRDENYYGEDASVFRPERWAEDSMKKISWAYLPFNGGPRVCLGQQFALTEASYVVVRLLQIFTELRSVDEEYPPKLQLHLTISLMNGANVVMQ